MLRVALYTPNYPGVTQEGGIGTYTQNLAHALAALGHEPTVLTPGSGLDRMDGPIRVRLTSTRHLPLADRLLPGAGASWHVARAMQRLARERKLDIVEFPNWEGFGLIFQQISRVPAIVRLHTSSRESQTIDQLPSTPLLRWDVRRERWQARSAVALVTHSAAHRQVMAEELEISAQRIKLIPHGVPTFPSFRRPPRGAGPPTVVYVGRMEKRKGTLDLLHAVPRVLAHIRDARFVLIGGDRPHCPGERTHAQYLADEFPAEVRQRVELLGRLPQSDVDRWVQSADVFVAPSLYESFGLVFPEAMRWGTPVIGTRVGGIPEIVTDGKTGLLVAAQQPGELAAAIVRVLTDRDLRERLGAAGRSHVESHLNVERMAHAAAELYASVVQKRGLEYAAAAG